MILWQQSEQPIACKVAVAGDFLPAGSMQPPDTATSIEMAERVSPLFEDADVSFLNLESSVDVAGLSAPPNGGLGATLGAPVQVLEYLTTLRAQPVGLANNHIFDYDTEGFERTRNAILAKGLTPLGCGKTLSDPPEIAVWESSSGVRIGFWAAANISARPASATRTGTEAASLQRGKAALALLKDRGAHCCVALLHAGLERTHYPEPDDVALMDTLAHTGFGLVAACHSHRISGSKVIKTNYGTAVCFYGLGSISSGMMYTPLEQEGIVAVISLNAGGDIVGISANPVQLADSGWGHVPSVQQGEVICERFRTVSAHIADGSYKQRFHQDIGSGLFSRQLRDFRAAFQQSGVRGIGQKISRVRMRHLSRAIHRMLG